MADMPCLSRRHGLPASRHDGCCTLVAPMPPISQSLPYRACLAHSWHMAKTAVFAGPCSGFAIFFDSPPEGLPPLAARPFWPCPPKSAASGCQPCPRARAFSAWRSKACTFPSALATTGTRWTNACAICTGWIAGWRAASLARPYRACKQRHKSLRTSAFACWAWRKRKRRLRAWRAGWLVPALHAAPGPPPQPMTKAGQQGACAPTGSCCAPCTCCWLARRCGSGQSLQSAGPRWQRRRQGAGGMGRDESARCDACGGGRPGCSQAPVLVGMGLSESWPMRISPVRRVSSLQPKAPAEAAAP